MASIIIYRGFGNDKSINEKKIEKQKYDKEKVKDYNSNYYQNRKDYLLEKIECKCGATVCRTCYNRHIKTRKHKKLVSTT